MIAYAIRRILWAIPTLFGISLVVFFLTTLIEMPSIDTDYSDPDAVLESEDRARARFLDLPRFFNPNPEDVRTRTDEMLYHLVAGDEQADLAAHRLVRIGGAALPYVMPQLERMPASARSRVALALAGMRSSCGIT